MFEHKDSNRIFMILHRTTMNGKYKENKNGGNLKEIWVAGMFFLEYNKSGSLCGFRKEGQEYDGR